MRRSGRARVSRGGRRRTRRSSWRCGCTRRWKVSVRRANSTACARATLLLRGGVPMNYHGLSDFRFAHGEVLDRLLTESLTALLAEGVITPEEIALDGTKVRANAGKGSFRRADKLAALEGLARQRVAHLKAEAQKDPAAGEKRRQAAQRRGAEDIARRAAEARRTLEKDRAEKAERAKRYKKAEAKKGEARVSLTDPEARMMRFP